MLKRQGKLEGMEEWELEDVKKRLMMARNWLETAGYGAILRKPEEAAEALKSLDARVVEAFVEAAEAVLQGAEPGEAVSRAAEPRGLSGREGRLQIYRAFYLALLGEESGPPLRRLATRPEVRENLRRILEILQSK
jgi:lysyl-tRNA synthetase class I